MRTASQGGDPFEVPPDTRTLPQLLRVRAVLVRFETPLIRYDGQDRIDHQEAVELMVTTCAPIPKSALSPLLLVGDALVDDYEDVGENLYRFYAFEEEQLHEGSPMRLAWPTRRPSPARQPPLFHLEDQERRSRVGSGSGGVRKCSD